MTEREKMLHGQPYNAADPELVEGRSRARRLLRTFNGSAEDTQERDRVLRELLGEIGSGVVVEPPFYCDYGSQIELGSKVYINMNCLFLDSACVRIGAESFLGPGVQIYTATHPVDPLRRIEGLESALAIEIGARVWIGGGAILCPGVSIGEGTTIGAGSVVTRPIPAGVVAAGNPCRVLRALTSAD